MQYNLPDHVFEELCSFAQKYSVNKIILFGSRARGTNTERSDIDIAVYGGDFDGFYWDVKEKIYPLLNFYAKNKASWFGACTYHTGGELYEIRCFRTFRSMLLCTGLCRS